MEALQEFTWAKVEVVYSKLRLRDEVRQLWKRRVKFLDETGVTPEFGIYDEYKIQKPLTMIYEHLERCQIAPRLDSREVCLRPYTVVDDNSVHLPQTEMFQHFSGMPPDPDVMMEGYLYKRSSNAFKTWNRRWFQIKDNKLLYSHRSADSEQPTVMEENLMLCLVRPAPSSVDRVGCFELVTPTRVVKTQVLLNTITFFEATRTSFRSHLLQADSEALCNDWMRALQRTILALHESDEVAAIYPQKFKIDPGFIHMVADKESRGDMFEMVLKFGAQIVDALRVYRMPVITYVPCQGELRGGAWVVLDSKINPGFIHMVADKESRGGILEANAIVGIKSRDDKLLALQKRNDEIMQQLDARLLEEVKSVGDIHDEFITGASTAGAGVTTSTYEVGFTVSPVKWILWALILCALVTPLSPQWTDRDHQKKKEERTSPSTAQPPPWVDWSTVGPADYLTNLILHFALEWLWQWLCRIFAFLRAVCKRLEAAEAKGKGHHVGYLIEDAEKGSVGVLDQVPNVDSNGNQLNALPNPALPNQHCRPCSHAGCCRGGEYPRRHSPRQCVSLVRYHKIKSKL